MSEEYTRHLMREMDHWSRDLDNEVHRVVFERCPHPESDRLRFSKAKVMPTAICRAAIIAWRAMRGGDGEAP